jgi:hypothetical protein
MGGSTNINKYANDRKILQETAIFSINRALIRP